MILPGTEFRVGSSPGRSLTMRGMVNPKLGTSEAGGGGLPRTLRPEVALARKYRRELSYPEVLLWQRLRAKAAGSKFRRQHPIGQYVADFYCVAARLVIEVDGQIHATPEQINADLAKDAFLTENGYRLVRVNAADILKDADSVATAIGALAASPLHHQPSAGGPPPRSGEDQA